MKSDLRKITAILALLLAPALVFAGEIKVLSFNMGARNRTAVQVAEMIRESGADIVFLQEVHITAPKDTALQKMREHLGSGEWDFISSSPYILRSTEIIGNEVYKAGGSGQNNAVLYNKGRLTVRNLAESIGFTHFGKVESGFLFDKNNVMLIEISPSDADARSCIAINVHLPYNDTAHRKRDLETLERLYARYKLRHAVIIAGDFNYSRKQLTRRNFDFVDGSEGHFYDPNFGIPTTLSTKGETQIIFASDYDHFIFNKKIAVREQMHRAGTDSAAKVCDRILFGSAAYTSSVDFRKDISDHVPIMMSVEIIE